MRSFRSECLSVATVMAIPLGIVAVFPFGAFGFRAAETSPRPARTAFVTLAPEAERRALRAARGSWREKTGGVRRLRADLFCAELPEDETSMSVLTLRDRSRPPGLPAVRPERTPFFPSQKAPPPQTIKPGNRPDESAFPRAELLNLN